MTLHSPELTRQHLKYQEVRARIWSGKPAKKIEELSADPKIIILHPRLVIQLWKLTDVSFDAHVRHYQRRLVELACNPALVYVKDRCLELEISYHELVGPSRRREIVKHRHFLIWEVATIFGLSYPKIGRLFGGRDHTSALFAVRKIEAMKRASNNDK